MNKRNPGAFYFRETEPMDWTSPQNDALWRDDVKTLFDPCPAGWRVPKGGKEQASLWYNFGIPPLDNVYGSAAPNATKNAYDTPESGYYCYRYGTSGATAWYPCASFREPDGIIKYTGLSSLVWTSTGMDPTLVDPRMHDLYFYHDGIRCWGGDVGSYGNSVRCVRE